MGAALEICDGQIQTGEQSVHRLRVTGFGVVRCEGEAELLIAQPERSRCPALDERERLQ